MHVGLSVFWFGMNRKHTHLHVGRHIILIILNSHYFSFKIKYLLELFPNNFFVTYVKMLDVSQVMGGGVPRK